MPLTVFADSVPPTLIGWATQMASRFARPAYLTGSALELPEPRDIDVRVVVSDDEWQARYGCPADYVRGCWLPQHVPAMRRYWQDMAKLGEQGVRAVRANIDFCVQPYSFAEQFAKKPRKRIDVVDGVEAVGAFAEPA